MITENELKEHGYEVLPRAGWLRIDCTMMPKDWYDICKDFGVDPSCDEIILAIAGVKQVFWSNEETE